MRNVKSGVRMCQRKAEISPFLQSRNVPFLRFGLCSFSRSKNLLPKLWGCGREARECGQPVVNARRNARSMPLGRARCPRAVHTPRRAFFLGHSSSELFWDTHRCRDTHPPPQQGHPPVLGHPPQQGHPSRALPEPRLRAHRDPLDPGGDGCPRGRPGAMAVLAASLRWLSLRPAMAVLATCDLGPQAAMAVLSAFSA